MPAGQSVQTTRRGEFRRIMRALENKPALRARTPVVFCEGDSWFSTPLAMNLLDWLVFPTPQEEARGVPIVGQGGLFFRAEHSGDLALDIFKPRNFNDLMRWYGGFDFDIALLSAGGNDFVGTFLEKTFARLGPMTPQAAFDVVRTKTTRYADVRNAYASGLARMLAVRPNTPIIGHTYAYPLRMGVAAELTLANIGAIALMKDDIGPWIGPPMKHVLPTVAEQRQFARLLIDGFVELVLEPLARDPRFAGRYRFIDLRTQAPNVSDWFDEMHPTGETFHRLSKPFAAEIAAAAPGA
ncbi:hypothetical protein LVB87_12855 [Lysobacter sp. KIS68-7]|uniref:hypothetical protein n=1 Tax=Lysobacter sp. KIS68-7 TaxID=2904252 RepID=UPI001E481EBD|nr:hypothetical protein [Lysobacter sp. KIS68-7]UHQ19064.1 hypothetical protein LVB87_12855 [Lysobacter sp. KIS68-7]